jgi:hypothetical protein
VREATDARALLVGAAVALAVAACSSSSSSGAGSDASSGDGAEGADGGGSGADGAAGDGLPTDGPGTSSDATLHELTCTVHIPKWDGSAPDGASCADLSSDTDRDGVPDCLDGCPYDAQKTAPGTCGCGTADIDTDGDGIADCMDRCPFDPNHMYPGSCGCVGEPQLQPAGTACGDPACPQTNTTCDGKGVCGDRRACSPCTGGKYVITTDGRQDWICGEPLPAVIGPGCTGEDGGVAAPLTRAAAQAACAAKGLTLARVESISDDRFFTKLLTASLWIGANDLTTPGDWYWPSATSETDYQLWAGGPDGSRQNFLYTNWASGAPGSSASCTSITLPDGYWADTDCAQTLGYVCQYLVLP